MKKLIKLSDYYYVIDTDTDAEIKAFDAYEELETIVKDIGLNKTIGKTSTRNLIIATTNPSLPLPQVINPSDELDLMVGKEVKVEISYHIFTNSNGEFDATTDSEDAVIKPISKSAIIKNYCQERGITYKDISCDCKTDDALTCNSNCGTLLEDRKPCKNCYYWNNKYRGLNKCFIINCDEKNNYKLFKPIETSTSKAKEFNSKFRQPKEIPTNETLEEVAEKSWYNYACIKPTHKEDFIKGFIAGYKHAESKMYSEDELIKILQRYKENCSKAPNVKEWFESKHFNKRLNPNN